MNLTAPFGLLALLAVPLVVFLHLFRRRLRERRVAGLFLFAGERLVAQAGRTRTRLLRTASLWLECLAAAVFALWLAGPTFGGVLARHVVFVLDDSASMAAGDTPARVAAAVLERTRDLGGGDAVTLLRTGSRAEVLLGPRGRRSEVGEALRRWRPTRPRHDPLPALDLARELAAGQGEVVFFTDEAAPPGLLDVTVLAFGQPAPNCAILTAQRLPRAVGDGEELRFRVGGWRAGQADWTVGTADRALLRGAVALDEGLGDVVVPLPPGLGALQIRLAPDALAVDDEAWLLPAPDRTVSVCNLLPAALGKQLELPRVLAALSGFRHEIDPLQSQLVLTAVPGTPLSGQTEVVFAPGDAERQAFRGPFVLDRGHPWLQGLQLQGVVWLSGRRTLPGQVLVAANDRPLVSEEFVDAGRRLWIDLDPSAGNLMRSPDWPLLFANVLEACSVEVPGPEQPNVVLGGEARFRRSLRAGSGDSDLWLELPSGQRQQGRGGRTVGWLVEEPGIHRVRGAGDRELAAFAVRFHDASESDLRGLQSGVWPRAEPGAATGALYDTSFERRLLTLLLMVLLLLDWWVLGRRDA